eukprot:46491-Pleurochrysis_carterae.AAC.1
MHKKQPTLHVESPTATLVFKRWTAKLIGRAVCRAQSRLACAERSRATQSFATCRALVELKCAHVAGSERANAKD